MAGCRSSSSCSPSSGDAGPRRLHGAGIHAPAHVARPGSASPRAADGPEPPAWTKRASMRWTEYAVSVLLFGVVSMVVLYAIERLQRLLPLNPQSFGPVAPALAFNTAASFTTNTNWQAYGGETTMSYFTQMVGLAYHNFVSAAVGIAVAIAFIRGIAQKEEDTIGNFWVDLTRATSGCCCRSRSLGALVARVAGRRSELQTLRQGRGDRSPDVTTTGADGKPQTTVRARAGDRARAGRLAGNYQAVRHQWRRLLQREQLAPLREPDAPHELPRDVRYLRDLGRPHLHARLDDRIAAPRVGGVGGDGLPLPRRSDDDGLGGGEGQSAVRRARIRPPATSPGATWKERRRDSASRTRRSSLPRPPDASCGEAKREPRLARRRLGGLVPLVNIMLGEVIFGGVGAGRTGSSCSSSSRPAFHRGADWSAARRSTSARRSRPSTCRWRMLAVLRGPAHHPRLRECVVLSLPAAAGRASATRARTGSP